MWRFLGMRFAKILLGVFLVRGRSSTSLSDGSLPAASCSLLLPEEVIVLITGDENRLLTLLWFVGYCGEFPSQLASRIGGHPEWNRHVMYRAIHSGYVSVYRGRYRQRVIRSLRLTDLGMDYIGERDPEALSQILAKLDASPSGTHSSIERIVRAHALAIGMVMAYCAGARILPNEKPSIMAKSFGSIRTCTPQKGQAYFYSPAELRRAMQELDENTVPKGSRIIGVIVKDRYLYLMYHTGSSRMVWFQATEDNTTAAIETILQARGFNCEVKSQIIIGSSMAVAEKISRHRINVTDRYFTVSNAYNNCFFITNNLDGDELLSLIIDSEKQKRLNAEALAGFNPPSSLTRQYDATSKDGSQPVILNYKCDLVTLLNFDFTPDGFNGSPIMLCFDYQMDALQRILGPQVEVRQI